MTRNNFNYYKDYIVQQELLANSTNLTPACPHPPCPPPPYPPCPCPPPPYPPCPCPPPFPYPPSPIRPPEPFRSCYIEALGSGQEISANHSVVFDKDSVDSTGGGITLDPTGTIFTILRTGLYRVEWSINVAPSSFAQPVVFGIIENGQGASGAAGSTAGNTSSGTLINVTDVPFTISLYNYGGAAILENPTQWNNSAVSLRISRFADEAFK